MYDLKRIHIGHVSPETHHLVRGNVVVIHNEDKAIGRLIVMMGLDNNKPKKIGDCTALYDANSKTLTFYENEHDVPKSGAKREDETVEPVKSVEEKSPKSEKVAESTGIGFLRSLNPN